MAPATPRETSPDEAPLVPPATLRRFAAAEERTYPLAMTDPERYQLATSLIGLLAHRLRQECTTVDQLLDRLPTMADRVTDLAAAESVPTSGLDQAALADCAAALRYRELRYQQTTGT